MWKHINTKQCYLSTLSEKPRKIVEQFFSNPQLQPEEQNGSVPIHIQNNVLNLLQSLN